MSFNLETARTCCRASADAYASRFLVRREGQYCIVAFPGTHCLADWVSDFRCRKEHDVHRGFLARATELLSPTSGVEDAIKSAGPAPLVVAGHSLGGALALLVARGLRRAGHDISAVYTFGGPRVFGLDAAAEYESSLGVVTWRVVDQEDIVPRLPLWTMRFRHVGREAFIPSVGNLMVDPPLWFKLVSDAVGTLADWRAGRLAQLADHHIGRYMEALNESTTTVLN